MKDEAKRALGVPTADDEEWFCRRAPDVAPPLGTEPESGFVEEVVWVESPAYTGVGFCDDESYDGPFGGLLLIVYPGPVHRGPHYLVNPRHMRAATKSEVEAWFSALRQERA